MIQGLYLTGGRSSRMGTPKQALLHPDGTSFLDKAYQTLVALTHAAFINTSEPDSTLFYPQVCDDAFDTKDMGPLGGLLAAYRSNPEASWLVLACDLPAVDREALNLLIDHSSEGEAVAFVNPIDNVPEATATLYHPAALVKLEAYLDSGARCARHFLDLLEVKVLNAPTPHTLQNVNYPADYEEWKLRIAKGGDLSPKKVGVEFYAKLAQDAGLKKTEVVTHSVTIAGLWEECRLSQNLSLKQPSVKPAVNHSFVEWGYQIKEGDLVAFMPPFAGG